VIVSVVDCSILIWQLTHCLSLDVILCTYVHTIQEYIPGKDSGKLTGGSTIAVVSLVIEIQGDETKYVL
jgi:hypothetical protein